MRYTFSKEIIDRYFVEGFGNYRDVKYYEVFEGSTVVGQFYFFDDAGFFRFNEMTLRLERHSNLFKTNPDKFINQETGHALATCQFKGWSNGLGTVTYRNKEFKFRKGTAATRASLFNLSTWGHYKMNLSNELDGVSYQFQVKRTLFTMKKYNLHPFTGEIETWGNADLMLSMIGLYLIERKLILDDQE